VTIHSSGQTVFGFSHIEGITLGVGKEVDEVVGASGLGMYRISEVGDWASEGQSGRMYGTGFTTGSLTSIGGRGRMLRPGIGIGSDEELMEVRGWQNILRGTG
jgi:hypothetical protein